MSAHRDPETVADYAKNARMRGLRVIIAGAGLAAALPGRGRGAHRPAGDRRAAHLEDLGGRRARRAARDRADAARRAGGLRRRGQREERRRAGGANPRAARDRALHAPEMGAVWSEQRKLDDLAARWSWRSSTRSPSGRGPGRRTPRRSASAPSFTVEAVKEREKVTDHDVAAFVDVVARVGRRGRALGPPRPDLLGRARHRAWRCSSREAGLILVRRRARLPRRADPPGARARGHALRGPHPRHARRADHVRRQARRLRLRGAAQPAPARAGGRAACRWARCPARSAPTPPTGPRSRRAVLERLGLGREDVSTQVVPRDRHAELL